MLGNFLAVAVPTELPSITDIVSNVGSAITWIFTHFNDMLSTILSNSLLVYVIGIALGSAILFAVLKIVRKFGVKGKRFR